LIQALYRPPKKGALSRVKFELRSTEILNHPEIRHPLNGSVAIKLLAAEVIPNLVGRTS